MSPQFKLIYRNFKPSGREIWEDWSSELNRRGTVKCSKHSRTKVYRAKRAPLSQDGQGVYHFMEVADLEQACETFEKSRFPIDGDTAKLDATFDERVELG